MSIRTKAASEQREVTQVRPASPHLLVLASGGEHADLRISALEAGVPMNRLTVPISPVNPPRDDRLFVDPASKQARDWLPRYRLGEELVAGERRYQILMRRDGDNWRLELTLERFAAPQIAAKAMAETVLPHSITIQLSFDVGSGAQRSLAFDEVGDPAETVHAALTLSSLSDRDQVLSALREPGFNARLTVTRKFRVAVSEKSRAMEASRASPRPGMLRPIDRLRPIDALRPIPAPVRPIPVPIRPKKMAQPKLKFLGKKIDVVRNVKFQRYWVSVENWKSYSAHLFALSPNLPPCGNNRNASRTWVDLIDGKTKQKLQGFCALSKPDTLSKLWLARKVDAPQPASVRVKLTDRVTKQVVISAPISLGPTAPPVPTFRVLDAALDHRLEQQPFSFAPALHPYVYDVDGLGDDPISGPSGTLQRHRETFGDLTHSYFQERRFPAIIYFLPDQFRLVRFTGEFRPPRMTLRISQPGDTTETAQAALDYAIAPYTDAGRLAHAAQALASRLSIDVDEITFQPLLPQALTYTVRRPTGRGAVHEERVATPRMLQEPLFDTLEMPVDEFQAAFEMMRSDSAGSIGGTVRVDIEGLDSETIPVSFNFTEMGQDAVEIRVFVGGSELLVKLTNRIESPIVLEQASLRLTQGDDQADVQLAGTDDPLRLEPGAEVELSAPIPAGLEMTSMTAQPLSGFTIDPDSAALLNAIVDTDSLEYFRTITVEAIPSTFRLPDDPDQQVFAILVVFENGFSVTLRADDPVAQVRIDYPFADILLGNAVENTFRYSRTIVRVNGEQNELEETTSHDDHIFITGNI